MVHIPRHFAGSHSDCAIKTGADRKWCTSCGRSWSIYCEPPLCPAAEADRASPPSGLGRALIGWAAIFAVVALIAVTLATGWTRNPGAPAVCRTAIEAR